MPRLSRDRLIPVIERLLLMVSLAIALVLPLGYWSLAYRNLAFEVDTLARVKAGAIAALVAANPGLWATEVQRIKAALASGPIPIEDEAASVYDANGVLIARAGDQPGPPSLQRAHALNDFGRAVGRVEVAHSLRGLIFGTTLAALLGLSLGGTVYGVLRSWPLRALRQLNVELDAAESARRESEERFRSVWENSADGMRLCDATGTIISVNAAYCSMVGKTIEELKGKCLVVVYAAADAERILHRFISDAAAGSVDRQFERELTLWHGGKRWFGVTNSFLGTPGGPILLLSIFRDISERKRSEGEVRTLSRAMDQSTQAHEGAIEVDTRPGGGATFTLYLPAASTGDRAALADAAATTAGAPGAAGSQHILYIDDDEALVFLVHRLMERRGYRVSAHTDQGEALAALRAEPAGFDLVVTDYNMPGMSGLDVARAVREIRADLPVAVASGFIDETLRAEASGAGVRELIFKANAAEDLCDAFARLAETVAAQANVT